jgi:hypothetical protein
VFQGKAYNKGLRVHKLTVQALWKMIIPELLSYTMGADPECQPLHFVDGHYRKIYDRI